MSKSKTYIGEVFDLYTVIGGPEITYSASGKKRGTVKCKCVCGEVRDVAQGNLRSGNSKSCGCRNRRVLNGSPEHKTWRGMIIRCNNPKATGYARYGGAGIKVCEPWMEFDNFYADMGKRPDGHTLDRIDGQKGYFKGNCKWSTRREQCNNRKNNRRISYGGITMTIAEWARHLNIKHVTLKQRLRHGWPIERAFNEQVIPPHEKTRLMRSAVEQGMGLKDAMASTGLSKGAYYNALKALQMLRK